MVLPSYIPIPEAAQRLHLEEKHLRRLIDNGKINAVTINGETVVKEQDVIKMTPTPKDQLPEHQKVKHLKGKPIWMNEAARKYDVSLRTIQRWADKNLIKKIGTDSNRVLLDEADVAYCKAVYKKMGGSQGKRIFNPDGTPFTPRPSRRNKTQEIVTA